MTKVAIPAWKNRISPVFESSGTYLLADCIGQGIENSQYLSLDKVTSLERMKFLLRNSVDVLICGAISKFYFNLIKAHDIDLIPFVTGNVDQVLLSYCQGRFTPVEHTMPGCGRKRRRRFRGGF